MDDKIYIPLSEGLCHGLSLMLQPVQCLIVGQYKRVSQILALGGCVREKPHPSSRLEYYLEKHFSLSPAWIAKAKLVQNSAKALQSYDFGESDPYAAMLNACRYGSAFGFELDDTDRTSLTVGKDQIVSCLSMFFLGWHMYTHPKAIACMADMAKEEQLVLLWERLCRLTWVTPLDLDRERALRYAFQELMSHKGIGAVWSAVCASVDHIERVRKAYAAKPLRHFEHGGLL